MTQLFHLFKIFCLFSTFLQPLTCQPRGGSRTWSVDPQQRKENKTNFLDIFNTSHNHFNNDIFITGDGFMLFNNTQLENSNEANSNAFNNDRIETQSTSTSAFRDPTFTVKRNPDGKLSWVFNASLSLQNSGKAPHRNISRDIRPISFPMISSNNSKLEPDNCKTFEGKFCTKVQNYPNLEFDPVLSRAIAQLGTYFVEDIEEPKDITQRFGDDAEDQDLCDSVKKTIYPQAGLTTDNRYLYILNQGDKIKQGIHVEECRQKDTPCKIINDFLPRGYTSVCIQKHIRRSLVAINEQSDVSHELFPIPSCCKCVLRKVQNT